MRIRKTTTPKRDCACGPTRSIGWLWHSDNCKAPPERIEEGCDCKGPYPWSQHSNNCRAVPSQAMREMDRKLFRFEMDHRMDTALVQLGTILQTNNAGVFRAAVALLRMAVRANLAGQKIMLGETEISLDGYLDGLIK